jgi:DNA-binding response OmpR family regulator
MLLELHGHEAPGPRRLEAVEAATRLRPDVILLDIGLPTLSGYETARGSESASGKAAAGRPHRVGREDRRRSEEAGLTPTW